MLFSEGAETSFNESEQENHILELWKFFVLEVLLESRTIFTTEFNSYLEKLQVSRKSKQSNVIF